MKGISIEIFKCGKYMLETVRIKKIKCISTYLQVQNAGDFYDKGTSPDNYSAQ
jgi:hypothetical protein